MPAIYLHVEKPTRAGGARKRKPWKRLAWVTAVSVCQLSFTGKLGIGICLQKGEGISMPFSVSVQERLPSKICVKVNRTLGRLFRGTKVSFISF